MVEQHRVLTSKAEFYKIIEKLLNIRQLKTSLKEITGELTMISRRRLRHILIMSHKTKKI